MAQTFNEELLDAMIRHQVGLLQFSGGVRNKIWKLIDATEADLKKQIAQYAGRAGFTSPARVQRLDVLLGKLRATRARGWREATKVWFEEMNGLAVAEPHFFDRVIAGAVPVELGAILPEASMMRQIVTSRPFEGKTLRQWSRKVAADDIARIEDQIKIGLIQGESIPQLSRRIVGTAKLKGRDGVTQIARNNAATITRTVSNGVANDARQAYMLANKDLTPRKLFTATLDSRTTKICMRFSGTTWAVDDLDSPVLPLHFNERSIYSPIVSPEAIGERPRRDFTQRSLLREYSKGEGFRPPLKRADLPRGHKGSFDTWSRKRMRELTGRTPASTTYGQWLGRQAAGIQDDILGPTRGALFRRGSLEVSKFTERTGATLTLSQLASRYPGAFDAAGLDPASFL